MSTTVAVAPRTVFCVLDSSYRDLTIANEVAAGRFTVAGHTLTLGVEPDWCANPFADDKEWRIEWVKFYYGLDLAHAFAVTRDPRYLATWRRLVMSFVAQVPARVDDTEVAARRIQNWIYAWNRFSIEGRQEPLTDSEAQRVATYLWSEVEYVRDHLTVERNHRTLELYALFIAALAFPCLDHGAALRAFAFEQLHQNLLDDVRPDGVHRECSTHYHCIALRSFLGAMRNAQRAGLDVPHTFRERVLLASRFALHCHRPDGRIPACSDADSDSYADVLLLAGQLLERPDFLYGASGGCVGEVPTECCVSFPHGGYFMQRSGWGTDRPFSRERFLIFDCGPLGDGGHGHYDQLSVEVASGGRPLLVDPGRFTYAETPPNWRRWFKGTAAHNTVVVDGLDQTPYARRKPKGPVASGQLVARATAPRLDLIVGQCTSPAYEAVHTRAVLFVSGEYWLVADRLHGQRPHLYELRWHLSPQAGVSTHVHDGPPTVIDCNGLTLTLAAAGSTRIDEGWYAPAYGVKHPAPVVVTAIHATSAAFVTTIVPRDAGSTGVGAAAIARAGAVAQARVGDAVATRRGGVSVDHGLESGGPFVVEVRGTGRLGRSVDVAAWSFDCHRVDLPCFRGTARAAWCRFDSAGELLAFNAVDVRDGEWTGPTGRLTRVSAGDAGVWVAWSRGGSSSEAGGRAE